MNNKEKKFREVFKGELEKGKDIEKIYADALKAGASEDFLLKELGGMQSFFPILGDFLKTKNPPKKKAEEKSAKNVWDPIGEEIYEGKFDSDQNSLKEKYEEYKKNPHIPRRNLILLSIPAICIGIILLIFPELIEVLAKMDDGRGLGLLALPFMPIVWYVRKIFCLQRDMIKMIIADKNNWIYSPLEKKYRWDFFKKEFKEFFNKGNENQNIQDEFWGKIKKTPFYSGIFEYTVIAHGSKGRRRKKIHRKNCIAIKLNKKLKTNFRLEPENIISRFFSFFRSKEIDLESYEFNKRFAFFYNGEKSDKELEIVKTLSPSVQIRLLEMAKTEGNFSLEFKEDIALFMFDGRMMKKMKSNFFVKVELKPEDQEKLDMKLNNILSIAEEIVPFLD